jgi:hypothetical protein
MAVTNIVSGELRNKVGAFVGAKWKGRAYVRAYVHPKDANTEAQQAVRGQFKKITTFGSAINEGILKPYQAKPVKNQSPYNRFVQINKDVIGDDTKSYADIHVFHGTLPTGTALAATASAATQIITVSFTPLLYGTAKPEDVMIALAYNETGDTFGYGTIERGGTASTLSIDIPGFFEDGDSIVVYLTACQPKIANGSTISVTITAAA